MNKQKPCKDCYEKHNCQEIYQHLGNAKGPSVAAKAVIAFLLPLTVFIIMLVAFERFSAPAKKGDHTAVLALLPATLAALAVVIITKVVRRKLDKPK